MADIKWSSFPSTTGTTAGDSVVGLHSGANERFLVSSTPSASGIAVWDANSNLSANSTINGYATTATAAGTTTLTVASKYQQYFTGSTTQTVVMPVTSTLMLGQSYLLVNNSSGNVTVNASDASLILTMTPNTAVIITCISISVTTNAAWNAQYQLNQLSPSSNVSGVVLTGGNTSSSVTWTYNYVSLQIGNTFYPNLFNAVDLVTSIDGPTTISFGNIQVLSGFGVNWPNTTSIAGNNILYLTSLVVNTPSLTTLSFPILQQVGAVVLSNGNSLTTFSLPSATYVGSLAFTQATSLTTINLPLVTFLASSASVSMSGTAAALTTVTLTNLISMMGSWTLTANSLTTLSLPALVNIGSASVTLIASFTPVGTSLATISMPSLVSVNGSFSPTLAALTSLTLTSLQTVVGAFGLTAATLTTLSLPALTTVGGGFSPVCASATTVTLTSLANIAGAVAPSFAALTTLSFPAIVSASSTWTITAANLVTFSLGATLKSIGGNFTMTGMKLDQASVDGILVSLAALDGTGGTTAYSSKTINLSGGTSSAPSATGLAAKVTLQARSCTVTTN